MPQTPEEIALERIRQAAESGAETLDLKRLGLKSLPDELWELTHIKELDLQDNQISELPKNIEKLVNLTKLDIDRNRIPILPRELWNLSKLNKLYISGNLLENIPAELWENNRWVELGIGEFKLTYVPEKLWQLNRLDRLEFYGNQLASLPREIGQLQNLTQLDLSSNQLASLPREIVQLQNLTQLYLSSNQLASLPREIVQLQNLTQLYLSSNQLASLPPEIVQLQNLTQLVLRNNQLASLPPEIVQLQHLTQLYLSSNQLASLPREIGQLQNLTQLDLRNNQLASLPREIGQLQHLTQLDLSSNQLASLPREIGQLQNLTQLDLSSNQLASLPREIVQLQNLTQLYLSSNQLASLPREIVQLQNLTSLDLSSNQLASLPPEIVQLQNLTQLVLSFNKLASLPPEIVQLQHLTQLVLSFNKLASLPPEIVQLQHLTQLFLSFNKLASLPPEIVQLQNLTTLDLRNNQLASLPREILSLQKLERLNLHGTPLAIALPTELLGNSFEGGDARRILEFYKKLWEEGGHPLGEARVLVVGQPQVGKTSLVNRLKDGSFNAGEDSTITVEMHTLPAGDNTAQIWDFGGQEHMHATHPFFFSARCVYLLVINVRDTEEQNRLEYWLRTIALYGKDSPIILVGNKADKNQHTLDIPEKRLKRDYPNLKAVVETSAQDDLGIAELRAAVVEQVGALPQVRVELPVSYLAVKEAMDEEKTRKNIISLERYVELCEGNAVNDKRDQNNLLALLHDLGTVFHFKDEEGNPISEVGILNPNWVTQGVYRVINSEKVRKETKGRLTLEMVHEILPSSDYAHHHCRLIIDLMKRFELCYQADDSTFWLPNLMEKSEPETGNWESALTFEYEYPELPENVITRFIVRTHQWIYADNVWRTGVHLEKDGNQALVRANLYTKRLTIQVNGRENTRRDLLSFLRGHFDEIHKPFDPKPKAYIYPKEHPDVRISFDELLVYETNRRDRYSVTAKGGVIDLSVRELLNGFIDLTERERERLALSVDFSFLEENNRPREVHYHEHKHIEVGENVNGSVINMGDGNTSNQSMQNSFNTFPADVQHALSDLMKATESLLQQAEDSEHKDDVREELESLQSEAKKSKPKKERVKVTVESLAQAARNLNEIGKPVLELATTVIKLINNLP
ncbi:MAG TPA: COR domain-containing protein [Anaerolineales bacterium]|nr:COR domain-containing protein [Anaerolineales bacterium]